MATSGSIDFSLTAREVIEYALKKLRVLAPGEAATASQADDAMQELTLMLKTWQKHEDLWRLEEGSFSVVADTASYTLSPMPHKVVSARFKQDDRETPMTLLTREEYFDLPLKTATGIPTQYYVDRQRTQVDFYVWPLMSSVDGETVEYTYLRQFDDIDSLDDDIDVRADLLEVVGMNLAARLLDNFGRTGEIATRIMARADFLLEDALDDDREPLVRFVPGRGM